MEVQNDRSTLQYQLRDIFEMHLSQDEKIIQSAVKRVLTLSDGKGSLDPIFSFCFGDAVVLVRNGNAQNMNRIFLVNPGKESCRMSQIKLDKVR